MITQLKKAQEFLAMHRSGECFLMPNAWDAGSAKILVAAGFKTIGTTSAGMAFSMGKPDNGFCSQENRVDRSSMLAEVQEITAAVSVPVNADLEAGFGDSPAEVAKTIQLAIQAGAVGGNIEDYTGDASSPLYDMELAKERVQAAREAIDRSGIPFVLVARSDVFNSNTSGNFSDAVERANMYREAGADCLFVPGVSDIKTVSQLTKEIDGPLNVVMGLSGSDVSMAQLAEAGVQRISIGGSLARSLYFKIREAAQEMMEFGTFNFANEQIPQSELNKIFETNF